MSSPTAIDLAAALVQERDRIAAELSRRVIGQLSSVSLALCGQAASTSDRRHAQQLLQHVDRIDAAIAQIRSVICELDQPSVANRTRMVTEP